MKKTFILLMAMSFLSSCKSTKDTNAMGTDAKAIENKLSEVWTLEMMNGKQVTAKDFNQLPKIELTPSTATFSGNTGCNDMKGVLYSKGKGQLRFLNITSEKKKCKAAKKEDEFMKLLKTTERYSIDNSKLTFENMFGTSLVFKKGS